MSPVGTAEGFVISNLRSEIFSRPYGTHDYFYPDLFPALQCWATFNCPYGTKRQRAYMVSDRLSHPQTRLKKMEGDVLGVAARGAEHFEHAARARVVERVDEDERVALGGRVVGEPAGDGVAGALVVRGVGEVVFLGQVVVEEHGHVVPLGEPADGRPNVAGHV